MKIRLLVSRAGATFSQNAGDTIEVDEAEGLRMIEAGQAVVVTEKETAVKKQQAQKAVK